MTAYGDEGTPAAPARGAARSATPAALARGAARSATPAAPARGGARSKGEPPSLSVGVNAADLLHLGRDLDRLVAAGVSLFHIDVMDGVFCPRMAGGPELVRAVAGAGLEVDLHLMIDAPESKLAPYVKAGARRITFHVEATRHPHGVLEQLGAEGVAGGVALNPGTPLGAVEPLLDQLDQLLLLAVDPGWPGQAMATQVPQRIRDARALRGQRSVAIAVDGAVTRENLASVAALGPDVVVAGSAVFSGDDLARTARSMLDSLRAEALR